MPSTTPVDLDALQRQRHDRADAEFSSYDFHGAVVESADGWEYAKQDCEMTRVVYLEPVEGADASEKAYFTVLFRTGADAVADAYAITRGGSIFGARAEQAVAE